MQLPSHEVEFHVSAKGFSLTWDGVFSLVQNFKNVMYGSNYMPKTVVAVGRGGMIPARLIALDPHQVLFLGLRSYKGRVGGDIEVYQGLQGPSVGDLNTPETLFIDDLWDSGQTMSFIKNIYPEAKRGTLITKKPAIMTDLDYCGFELVTSSWIIFPWE